jgi:hypothetical protein
MEPGHTRITAGIVILKKPGPDCYWDEEMKSALQNNPSDVQSTILNGLLLFVYRNGNSGIP